MSIESFILDMVDRLTSDLGWREKDSILKTLRDGIEERYASVMGPVEDALEETESSTS